MSLESEFRERCARQIGREFRELSRSDFVVATRRLLEVYQGAPTAVPDAVNVSALCDIAIRVASDHKRPDVEVWNALAEQVPALVNVLAYAASKKATRVTANPDTSAKQAAEIAFASLTGMSATLSVFTVGGIVLQLVQAAQFASGGTLSGEQKRAFVLEGVAHLAAIYEMTWLPEFTALATQLVDEVVEVFKGRLTLFGRGLDQIRQAIVGPSVGPTAASAAASRSQAAPLPGENCGCGGWLL